jgi:asparagine synthase
VEFAFALPDQLRWRGVQTKLVLRRALRDLLPPLIRDRPDKAEYSAVFAEEYGSDAVEELFQEPAVERIGWVRPRTAGEPLQALRSLYRQGDARFKEYTWAAHALLALEVWLRAAVQE